MTSLRSIGIAVSVFGIAFGMPLTSDDSEAFAQTTKAAGKSKAPQRPKAVKPHVQKKADTHVRPVGAKMPEAQKTSDLQLVEAFRALRSVKKTLIQGDHDYGGHRIAAVRDVGKAEKQLEEALKYRDKKSPSDKNIAAPWHPEPQKLSNAQLASRIPVLRRAISVLGAANHDYAGHRKQAVADLTIAVASLQQALKYAKIND